jgi:hypothetical protein
MKRFDVENYFGIYKLKSDNYKPIEKIQLIDDPVRRGWVFDLDDNFVCRGTDMPLEMKINEAQVYYDQLYEHLLFFRPCMEPVTIMVMRLLNNKGEPEIYITTNQRMNARHSKFVSPFIEKSSSHGQLFEDTLEAHGYLQKYKETFIQELFGTIDVWWIVPNDRSHYPFNCGDLVKFAYRIASGGKIKAVNDDGLIFHPAQYSCLISDRNQAFYFLDPNSNPCCLSALMTKKRVDENGDDITDDLTVSNCIAINIVNNEYERVKKAVNNEPDLMCRLILLMQYYDCDNVDALYEKSKIDTKGNMFRREEMDREKAMDFIKILLWYNPTFMWMGFLMFNRLAYRVYFEYKMWLKNQRPYYDVTNFWGQCKKHLNAYFQEHYKKIFGKITEVDVKKVLLKNFSCFVLAKQMQTEMKKTPFDDDYASILMSIILKDQKAPNFEWELELKERFEVKELINRSPLIDIERLLCNQVNDAKALENGVGIVIVPIIVPKEEMIVDEVGLGDLSKFPSL